MSLMEQNLEERQVWGTLPCRSLMKTSSRPLLVAPLAREGLWYAAGSGGRRQEMFVIRAFPSGKLPSSPDWAVGQGATEYQPWGLRQEGRRSWGSLGPTKGCTWG